MSETRKKNQLHQRMIVLHALFLLCILVIIARLIDLQILNGGQYRERAQSQQYGGVVLPARRGEILSRNSKTGETSILATNTTLDLVYVDPFVTDDPAYVARTLADILVTEAVHTDCTNGTDACPRELISFYQAAYDPLLPIRQVQSGVLLEKLSSTNIPTALRDELDLLDIDEVKRKFIREIEDKISEKRLTFVPLKYGATKLAMTAVRELGIAGIVVSWDQNLIYANPEEVSQSRLSSIARSLAPHIEKDASAIRRMLRSRPLRYVPVMHLLPPSVSLKIKERKVQADKETKKQKSLARTREEASKIHSPLRSIALIPEHQRFYPDNTVASHVVGFLNTFHEAQYGIERTYDPTLRGQEGLIRSVSDPQGGQILRSEQQVIDPKDGDTVVLTIDRTVQKEVEHILVEAVKRYDADSGQVIILNPYTGHIIAMANAPIFDGNSYGGVFQKMPLILSKEQEEKIVIEIYHPETNNRIIKAYTYDVFTDLGRANLSEKTKEALVEVESLYDLKSITRYYLYLGEHNRHEIFPTDMDGVWLKYENSIGVGAYINRSIQEIYEPGSVLKPITMAVAIDQGEIEPDDTYEDDGPLEINEFPIRNALSRYYGTVTMVNCLEQSINTCMTSVSARLGKKLFFRSLQRFGFGRITGVELEDELPGELRPWRKWSEALLATSAYGQGLSATPLQVVTAIAALANGGKLMRPTIVDRVINADGETTKTPIQVVDQVIKPQTAETVSAMLVSTVNNGYARTAKVKGYSIAGKTGTSQIAGPGGKYESGTGSSITSFVGYAPPHNPRFAMLVKIDRPRKVEYGSESAAPVFKEIATFLFKYYGIPPNEK